LWKWKLKFQLIIGQTDVKIAKDIGFRV
jgi:hypothetical protein